MAVNFTFGQEISRALGQTLDRNRQNRQFFQQLSRQLEQDAFNRKIRSLTQQTRQKQADLAQEKFEYQVVQDAIENDLKKKRNAALNRQAEASAANLESLAKSRGEGQGDKEPSQGAININLGNITRRIERKREQADELSSAMRRIHDTGIIPEELQGGLLETTDPTQAVFSLSSEVQKLQSEIDRLDKQRNALNSLSGLPAGMIDEERNRDIGQGIVEVTDRGGFEQLRENQFFQVPGQSGTFRKVNGQPVRVKDTGSNLIAPQNQGF